jgi:hypothetical protein
VATPIFNSNFGLLLGMAVELKQFSLVFVPTDYKFIRVLSRSFAAQWFYPRSSALIRVKILISVISENQWCGFS